MRPPCVTDQLHRKALLDASFTVTSMSGVEQLQRTQQLVRENGEWRVVMRSEQLAAFTAADNGADTGSAGKPLGREKAGARSGQKKKATSSSRGHHRTGAE